MTRFKELRRINQAIDHLNKSELLWALDYCRMRQKIATRKDHGKTWKKLEAKVLVVLGKIAPR